MRIWSRRYEHPVHTATVRGDTVTTINPTVKPEVKLGVMNARSVANKLDYVFDHIIDNNLDIVALTETWLSNEEVNNRRVVIDNRLLWLTVWNAADKSTATHTVRSGASSG